MIYHRFPNYKHVLKQNHKINASCEQLRILIVRDFTLENTFDSYLNNFLRFSIMYCFIEYISIDRIVELYALERYDYIVVWLRFDNILKNTSLSELEKVEQIHVIVNHIKQMTDVFAKQVVIIDGEPICYSTVSNADILDKASLRYAIQDSLHAFAGSHIYHLDTGLLYARYGNGAMSCSGHTRRWDMPFSLLAFSEYANLLASYIVAHRHQSKKCLILDCDNVLWGEVAEEVGIQNITLSDTNVGGHYQQFQKCVLDLHHRGVILAICSKNDKETVNQIFLKHPHMILNLNQFAVIKANWKDKDENLKEIAEELNISLDACVFVDDSPFEINWIDQRFPQVTTIPFTKEPEEMVRLMQTTSLFSSLEITCEDVKRNEIYSKKSLEKRMLRDSASYEDFLKSLEMTIEIKEATLFDTERIVQLGQRTNQFNINRVRYTDNDIIRFINDQNSTVYAVTYHDKFFDYGIVGTMIVRKEPDGFKLLSFCLSCKVLKRRVETAMLKQCIRLTKSNGFKLLRAHHIVYNENRLACEFITTSGFRKENEQDTYSMDIEE